MSETSAVPVEAPTEEFYQILKRTNTEKPAKRDIEALRKALKDDPNLWRRVADFARLTQGQLIEDMKSTAVVKESLQSGLETMRQEIGYEKAPPGERRLIEQVVLTWLHFHLTQHGHQSVISSGTSFRNAEFWEKRLNGAQRRYLRAVEMLARVRKLASRGSLQIKIAQQQVNGAGS